MNINNLPETMNINNLPEIDRSKVVFAYRGKPGCACGCLGRYGYSKATREIAGTIRGYNVEDSEISEAMILRVLKSMAALNNIRADAWGREIVYSVDYETPSGASRVMMLGVLRD